MYFRKSVLFHPSQMQGLEEIEKAIKEKGGEITKTQLIRDSVQIFIDYFKNDAIKKYTAAYEIREKATEQASKTESN